MEVSYGVIPLKKEADQWKVFMVKLASGSHWGFPKGHPEAGEEPMQTALRELEEESSLTCSRLLSKEPLIESYMYKKDEKIIQKSVFYYLIEASGEFKIQEGEILDGNWFSFEQAEKLFSFDEGRKLLSDVIKFLVK